MNRPPTTTLSDRLHAIIDSFLPLLFAALVVVSGLVPATSAQAPPSPQPGTPGWTNATYPPVDPINPSVDPPTAAAAFASPLLAGAATLFSDNFDDNLLDPSKWTVANAGFGVSEKNQRLEMSVREQMETTATVRSSTISRSFSSVFGVDANVNHAHHIAGSGSVERARFRLERADDATKWVEILIDPWANKVNLQDSNSNVHTLASVMSTGYHGLRLAVTGSAYTGYYDSTSFQVSSTLFNGAGGVKVVFLDITGGSTSGATETDARDDAIVYAYSTAVPPSAPQNLAATSGTPDTNGVPVALSWSTPSSNGGSAITGYTLERGPSSGGETSYQTLGNVHSYNDHCPAATSCYYVVRAVNIVGPGAASNEVSYKGSPLDTPIPSAPPVDLPVPNLDVPHDGLPAVGFPTDTKGFVVLPWGQAPIISTTPIPDANGTVAILFMLVNLPSEQSMAHLSAFDALDSVVYSHTNDLYSDGGPNTTALVYFKAIPTQGVARLQITYGSVSQDVDVDHSRIGELPESPCSDEGCKNPCEGDACQIDPCTIASVPVVCGVPPPPNPQVCEQPVVKDEPPCKPVPPPPTVCSNGAQDCVCDASGALSDLVFYPCGGDPPCDPSEDCVCSNGGTTCVTDKIPCGLPGKQSCQTYVCGTSGCNIEVCNGGGTSCVTDKVPCGLPGKQSCQTYVCGSDGCNVDVCDGDVSDCVPNPCSSTLDASAQSIDCISVPQGPTLCGAKLKCLPSCGSAGDTPILGCVPTGDCNLSTRYSTLLTCLDLTSANSAECQPPTCYEIPMPLNKTASNSAAHCYTQAHWGDSFVFDPYMPKQKYYEDAPQHLAAGTLNMTDVYWGRSIWYDTNCGGNFNGLATYALGMGWAGLNSPAAGAFNTMQVTMVYHGSTCYTDSPQNQYEHCTEQADHSVFVRPRSLSYVVVGDANETNRPDRFSYAYADVSGVYTNGKDNRKVPESDCQEWVKVKNDALSVLSFMPYIPKIISVPQPVSVAISLLNLVLDRGACKLANWQPIPLEGHSPDGEHVRVGNGIQVDNQYRSGTSWGEQKEIHATIETEPNACHEFTFVTAFSTEVGGFMEAAWNSAASISLEPFDDQPGEAYFQRQVKMDCGRTTA